MKKEQSQGPGSVQVQLGLAAQAEQQSIEREDRLG